MPTSIDVTNVVLADVSALVPDTVPAPERLTCQIRQDTTEGDRFEIDLGGHLLVILDGVEAPHLLLLWRELGNALTAMYPELVDLDYPADQPSWPRYLDTAGSLFDLAQRFPGYAPTLAARSGTRLDQLTSAAPERDAYSPAEV